MAIVCSIHWQRIDWPPAGRFYSSALASGRRLEFESRQLAAGAQSRPLCAANSRVVARRRLLLLLLLQPGAGRSERLA